MKNAFTVLRSKGAKLAAATSALVLAGSANAASVLPANFSMADVEADITTIGGALIGLAVVAVGIKWVKATFFG
ncbi:hypothetical protein CBP51_07055 [Cellvibrio mixtus]|uniref:Methyltransferase n=1 Tax=Cellvibrio mixtus TaxID=39650 RepID=A0A266QA83_9GAMM|nr:major capsid protein [Cellvibrio mixtus]OZY86762.1 hypothetical protein CBP51_07055 [Cellvibrio mixtus]